MNREELIRSIEALRSAGILTDEEAERKIQQIEADYPAEPEPGQGDGQAQGAEGQGEPEAQPSDQGAEDAQGQADAEEAGREAIETIEQAMDADGDDFLEAAFGLLVPPSGQAKTVAGEIVRAANRIGYRWSNDGDYFYEGYGQETAGPSAAYLADVCDDHVADQLVQIAEDGMEDDRYSAGLSDLWFLIEQFLRNNPRLFSDDNDEDSRTYGDKDYWSEYEPKYDTDIRVPDDLTAHLENGNISKGDLEYELASWEFDGKTGDGEFDVSYSGETIEISNLTKAAKRDWEDHGYEWLTRYAYDLTDEFGDPNISVDDIDPKAFAGELLDKGFPLEGADAEEAAKLALRWLSSNESSMIDELYDRTKDLDELTAKCVAFIGERLNDDEHALDEVAFYDGVQGGDTYEGRRGMMVNLIKAFGVDPGEEYEVEGDEREEQGGDEEEGGEANESAKPVRKAKRLGESGPKEKRTASADVEMPDFIAYYVDELGDISEDELLSALKAVSFAGKTGEEKFEVLESPVLTVRVSGLSEESARDWEEHGAEWAAAWFDQWAGKKNDEWLDAVRKDDVVTDED